MKSEVIVRVRQHHVLRHVPKVQSKEALPVSDVFLHSDFFESAFKILNGSQHLLEFLVDLLYSIFTLKLSRVREPINEDAVKLAFEIGLER